MARFEEHCIATVDARPALRRDRVLLPGRAAGDPCASPYRRLLDRLRNVRFRGAAYGDARHEEPHFFARLRLRDRWCLRLGPSADRFTRTCRCRFRASPALSAQQAASSFRILISSENRHSVTLKGKHTWKSSCWNASPSSDKWAKSSAYGTDLPAIFCSSVAKPSAPPQRT